MTLDQATFLANKPGASFTALGLRDAYQNVTPGVSDIDKLKAALIMAISLLILCEAQHTPTPADEQ